MRKHILSLCLLLTAAFANAEDVQRITVSGYRLGDDVTVRALSDLKGLTVAPESGQVYSNALLVTSNSNVFKATVPFGYRLSHWMRTWDDPRFERSLGEKIPGSEGALTLTVPYDGKGTWIYLAPIIVIDDRRTVTIAKSPFGEGTVGTNLGQHASMKGDIFKLKAIPKRDATTGFDHSKFRRWEDGSTDYQRDAVVDSNDTFRAEFVPNSWTVTFDPNGGEVFPTSKVVTCDATYGWLPTPTRAGNFFQGWFDAKDRGSQVNGNTKVGAVGDHTLFARWEAEQFVIGWDLTGEGNGTVTGDGIYAYGNTAVLTARPYDGSAFVRWTDGETSNPRRQTVVSNATYVAEFAVRTYSVTFSYKNERGERVKVGPFVVKHEGAVPKEDVPSDETVNRWVEHTFQNWSTEEYKRVVRDVNVEALYDTKTYSVEFAYRDWQGNCVTTMPQHVVSGGSATPPSASVYDNWEGMTFQGWQPDYSTIRNDVVIEALYKTNEYVITFCYCNEKGEEVQHKETVPHGEKIPFSFVNSQVNHWPDHTFKRWDMNGQTVAEGAVATRDAQIVAVYEGYSQIVFTPGEGGSGEMPTQVFTNFSGEATLNLNSFTNTGYAFTQWIDSDGATYSNGGKIKIANGEVITLTALWDPIKYRIVLDGNGGTCKVPPQSTIYNEPTSFVISSPETGDLVTRTGYALLRYWSREASVTNIVYWMSDVVGGRGLVVSNLTTVAGETVTLYAQWDPHHYEIEFDPAGGTGTMENQSFVYDAEQPLADCTYEKAGHAFVGWTNETTQAFYPAGAAVRNLTSEENGTVTLKAVWKANSYEVQFVVDGETVAVQTNGYGAKITAPVVSPKEGFTFQGWKLDGELFDVGTRTMPAKDIVLVAAWAENGHYTVRFNGNGGLDAEGQAAYEQDFVVGIAKSLKENGFVFAGHDFLNWTNAEGAAYSDGAPVVNLSSAGGICNLYAKWETHAHQLVWHDDQDGDDTVPCVSYGTPLEHDDPKQRTGYVFAGWSTNGVPVTLPFPMPDHDLTLKTTWKPVEYKISFDGGSAEGSMDPILATYDQDVTLTSNKFVCAGKKFAGWAETEGGPKKYDDGVIVRNLTSVDGATVTLFAVWTAEVGNPMALALGLGGDFGVAASPNDAWTVVGEPSDKNGLQRLDTAQEGGTLSLTIPSAGTLSYSIDMGGDLANKFTWKFNGEDLNDADTGATYYKNAKNAKHSLAFAGGGTLVFEGLPDEDCVWTLSNFNWEPAK